jgi:SAM-dependent methyltransferase
MNRRLRTILERLRGRFGDPAYEQSSEHWDRPFEHLRQKWHEVPSSWRVDVMDLQSLDDVELKAYWVRELELSRTGDLYSARGWYHELYRPIVRDAQVVDFGSGLGMDALHFAQFAKHVTCVDIVPENLRVISRVANILGRDNVSTLLVTDLKSFEDLPESYDVVWAQGSLHHAPERVIVPEVHALASRLRLGGRWVQLAYPRERWVREGRLPFHRWGSRTDGDTTPWAEWLNSDKLLKRFGPYRFHVLLNFNFCGDEFNWFDLMKR